MKIVKTLAKIIFSISLPVFLILSTVEYVSSDLDFYMESFEKNGVSETTGFSEEELSYVSEEIVKYLKGDRDDFDIELKDGTEVFGLREQLHMEDVQFLFERGNLMKWISLLSAGVAFAGIWAYGRKEVGTAMLWATIVPLLVSLGLAILIVLDFDGAFTQFHLLLFDNDLWLLDPRTDVLINMLPLDFFYRMSSRIATLFGLELLVLGSVGIFIRRLSDQPE